MTKNSETHRPEPLSPADKLKRHVRQLWDALLREEPSDALATYSDEEKTIARRTLLKGALGSAGVLSASVAIGTIDQLGIFTHNDLERQSPEPETTDSHIGLELKKAEFEQLSSAELSQWILNASGDIATDKQPVRTPSTSAAYDDLKNTVEGKPAYRNTLLTLDDEKIKMDTWINRDILMFRALLTVALQDPANYFRGKPILIQSGQLTNRSGSHSGRQNESHFFGNSIDFSGAIIDGRKSDEDSNNLYPYDSEINRQLGRIADEVGSLVGVKTSGSSKSLERVDSLQGAPGLSDGHYHYNVSSESAKDQAASSKESIKNKLLFETESPSVDLRFATISQEGRDFIHTYETFRSKTYGDAHPGGTLTIGYGATYYLEGTVIRRDRVDVTIEKDGQKPRIGDKITEQEADQLSKRMIESEYLKPVITALETQGMTVTQHQLDALVSYAYHRGGSNAVKLIKRLKVLFDNNHTNDALAIKAAFMNDINDTVAPRFRNGVADRYLDTADIFTSGDYTRHYRLFDAKAWSVIIAAYQTSS